MNLRHFLHTTGLAITGAATLPGAPIVPMPKGKAEHVIFIWLGGGMAQIDTFDPKRRGDSKASPKVAGSEYAAIDTAVATAIASGLRTGDIFTPEDPNAKKATTTQMGDSIAAAI